MATAALAACAGYGVALLDTEREKGGTNDTSSAVSVDNGPVVLMSTRPAQSLSTAEAEQLFQQALVTHDFASEEQAAMALNSWIAQSYSLNQPTDEPRSGDLIRACGERDIILQTMADARGIKARRINFFGVPYQQNHSATELLIDGRWVFFDSTAGLYFTREGETRPLGIVEAREAFPDIQAWVPKAQMATGRLQEVFETAYQPIDTNILKDPVSGIDIIDIERTYFISEMQGAVEPKKRLDGFHIDLALEPERSFGAVDGDSLDLAKPFFDVSGYEQYASQMHRLGEAVGIRSGYRMQFATDRPRMVTFTLHVTGTGHNVYADIDHVQTAFLGDDPAIETTLDGTQYQFTFKALPPMSHFSVMVPHGQTVFVDAFSWRSQPVQDLASQIRTPNTDNKHERHPT